MRDDGRGWWGRRSGGVAAVAVGLAACGPSENGAVQNPPPLPEDSARTAASPSAPAVPARPETVQDTVWLEGMPEPMTMRLYRPPAGFPLRFSTYLPADMAAEPATSGEGQAVRFVAGFGGVRNERAYLSVVVPAAELSAEEARVRTREIAERLGRAQRRAGQEGYPWAREWYGFDSIDGRVGSVLLGMHGSRPFFVIVHHPAEMGDGMGARVQAILDGWQWAESGAGLGA